MDVSLSLLKVSGNSQTCFSIYNNSEISEFRLKAFSRNILAFPSELFIIMLMLLVPSSSVIFSVPLPFVVTNSATPTRKFFSAVNTSFVREPHDSDPRKAQVWPHQTLMRRQDQGGWHDCMRSKYGRQYTQGETSPSWGRRGRLVISPVSYTTRTFDTVFTWIRHWSLF